MVELLLPKQVVEGSNPFARSSLEPALEADSKAVVISGREARAPIVHDSVHDIFCIARTSGLLTRLLFNFGSRGCLEVNQVLRSEVDGHFAPRKQDRKPAACVDPIQCDVKLIS